MFKGERKLNYYMLFRRISYSRGLMRWSCVITCPPLEQLHHSGSDFLPCFLPAGTRPMAANVRKPVNLLSTVCMCVVTTICSNRLLETQCVRCGVRTEFFSSMSFGFKGFVNFASSLDEFQLMSFSHSLKKRAFRIKIMQPNLLLHSVLVLRICCCCCCCCC